MYKKPLFLTFSVLFIFLFTYTYFVNAQLDPAEKTTTDKQETIQAASNKIMSLIEAGDFTSADTAIEQMKADFADNNELPQWLYQIAYKYEKVEAFKQGKAIYTQIAGNFPEQKWAAYANLQLAKLKIYELIDAGNYKAADLSIAQMAADFADCPELPESVWEAAKRYDKVKAFDYSKKLCEKFVADFPDNNNVSLAALLLERLKVYELIDSGKYEDASAAVDRIIKDFAGNRHLSRRLYEIAQQYNKKGALTYAGDLHGRIAADWPNDKYGLRSAVQHRKLEVYGQLDSNDFKIAQQTIAQMKKDFVGSDELYKQLDSVGERYEWRGQTDIAKNIFQEIIQSCPPDAEAAIVATARLKKYDIFSAIEDGNKAEVETIIQSAGSQLNGKKGLDKFLYTLAIGCYSQGRKAKLAGSSNRSADYFKTAVSLWEKVFIQCPNSPLAPAACFGAAAQSAQELDDYAMAVGYFQKVVDSWPEYKHADWAQSKAGNYLEKMVEAGQLTKEEAKPLIIKAYQALVDNYPKSRWVEDARQKLGHYK